MATDTIQPFEQSFHFNEGNGSHDTLQVQAQAQQSQHSGVTTTTTTMDSMASMAAVAAAAAAGNAAATNAASMMAASPNGYFMSHPYYPYAAAPQHVSPALSSAAQEYHPLMDYHGDFRPTFYNPFEIKHRRRTSRAQLKILENAFTENAKPNAAVRRYLAQQLDMTPRGVQIWFQNRRAKAKLQKRKSMMNGTSGTPASGGTTSDDMSATIPVSASTSKTTTPTHPGFMMTPTTSTTPTSMSLVSNSLSQLSAPLFYPMEELQAQQQQQHAHNSPHPSQSHQQQSLLLMDQPWLAMPIHPLQDNSITRRQSCPILNDAHASSSWDNQHAAMQSRRASEHPQHDGTAWMDQPDMGSCCSTNSSSCGTPGWPLDTTSPLGDHAILDFYPKPSYPAQTPQPSSLDFYDLATDATVGNSTSVSIPSLTQPIMPPY